METRSRERAVSGSTRPRVRVVATTLMVLMAGILVLPRILASVQGERLVIAEAWRQGAELRRDVDGLV